MPPCLYRRTRYGAIRTVHTAISRLWPEKGATPLALVEVLARIGGHVFRFLVSTGRACDHRLKNNRVMHKSANEW
ncbi:hypothetical protein NMYAN_140018 [Nitrosomonas nitrosa]|uniref:Uncharacterized protein n=1 Tax=Nitrosomonas nitrosa TaxID=52442 RepID=A0A8H9D9M7_9PROT|nr:hypothetical protein NMYAN_140018 [Nitrosomonas nitrosa]